MKPYILACLFVACMQAQEQQPQTQDVQQSKWSIFARRNLFYDDPECVKNLAEYNASLLLAAILGSASGLLCRHVEKKLLFDFLPFRLINLLLWGSAEDIVIRTILDDLSKHDIKHSKQLIRNGSWLISWLSYFLYDSMG